MNHPTTRARAARSQRGLSIVEMMVGITVGLIVVAAASAVVTTQLKENRLLLADVQMQQDLRAAADIVSRELRRSSSWAAPQTGVWSDDGKAAQNPHRGIIPESAATSEVSYSYMRAANDNNTQHGFKLENGIIKTLIYGAEWQELTDSRTLTVTDLTITPKPGSAFQLPCPHECPGGGTDCWPTITVRELEIAITGHAANDAAVTRSIRSSVRVRNDNVHFYASTDICPP